MNLPHLNKRINDLVDHFCKGNKKEFSSLLMVFLNKDSIDFLFQILEPTKSLQSQVMLLPKY